MKRVKIIRDCPFWRVFIPQDDFQLFLGYASNRPRKGQELASDIGVVRVIYVDDSDRIVIVEKVS